MNNKKMVKDRQVLQEIGQRIRDRRKQLGLSQEQLALSIGFKSRSSINKIEVGRNDIPQSMIAAIAEALNTTPAYIMGWDDDEAPADRPAEAIRLPDTMLLPILGRIACGVPIQDYSAQDTDDKLERLPRIEGADYALLCCGDSMINAHICDGDLVYMRACSQIDVNGRIYAVTIDGESTLKRCYLEGDVLTLIAENTALPPKIITGEALSDVRIQGEAIAVLRKSID